MRSLHPKYRFWSLVGGFFVFLLIFKSLSIDLTIETMAEYNRSKEELARNTLNIRNLSQVQDELELVRNQMGASIQSTPIDEQYMQLVSEQESKRRIKIKKLPQPLTLAENGADVIHLEFEMSGTFKELIQSLYEVERENVEGNVYSVRFDKQLNRITRRPELNMKVHVSEVSRI